MSKNKRKKVNGNRNNPTLKGRDPNKRKEAIRWLGLCHRLDLSKKEIKTLLAILSIERDGWVEVTANKLSAAGVCSTGTADKAVRKFKEKNILLLSDTQGIFYLNHFLLG